MSTGDTAPPGDAPTGTTSLTAKSTKTGRFLGLQWWQGVGAIAGIAGTIAAVIAISNDPEAAADPSRSQQPDQSVSITGGQNCVGNGNNNTVICAAAAEKIGAVELDAFGPINRVFYAGTPDRLPTPPPYPPGEESMHCDEWREWFDTDPHVYTLGDGFRVNLSGGANDLVVITDVRVKIFKKTPAQPGTTILCNLGGGSNAGVALTVDTLSQVTTAVPFDEGEEFKIPPGSLQMGLNDSGFMSASIAIRSDDGFLYEGQLQISALINGTKKSIEWGSPQRPFRWISDPDGRFLKDDGSEYGWDPEKVQWIQGVNLGDMGQ
ncbi:hypothetical protein AB0J80_37975 [Actinoplanes sp. NPDC049548]|uniref:hypothetical protein n=1 Tax=Actinoplanes sp. NPDC049548 TaxID=3155152 RepID=UPI003425E9DC